MSLLYEYGYAILEHDNKSFEPSRAYARRNKLNDKKEILFFFGYHQGYHWVDISGTNWQYKQIL